MWNCWRTCDPKASSRAAAASAASGHDAWAASPTTVHDAYRPRRPIMRHCMGERSCASSTSTWAYSSGLPMRPASSFSRGWVSTRGAPLSRAALRTGCTSVTPYWLRSSRSEEHTSELQSHVNLVCRLLLEKKKKQESDDPCPHYLKTTPTAKECNLRVALFISLPHTVHLARR